MSLYSLTGNTFPFGVFPALALQHHDFTRHADGKIGFRCEQQRKRLDWRGGAQFAVSVLVNQNLAGVSVCDPRT